MVYMASRFSAKTLKLGVKLPLKNANFFYKNLFLVHFSYNVLKINSKFGMAVVVTFKCVTC